MRFDERALRRQIAQAHHLAGVKGAPEGTEDFKSHSGAAITPRALHARRPSIVTATCASGRPWWSRTRFIGETLVRPPESSAQSRCWGDLFRCLRCLRCRGCLGLVPAFAREV